MLWVALSSAPDHWDCGQPWELLKRAAPTILMSRTNNQDTRERETNSGRSTSLLKTLYRWLSSQGNSPAHLPNNTHPCYPTLYVPHRVENVPPKLLNQRAMGGRDLCVVGITGAGSLREVPSSICWSLLLRPVNKTCLTFCSLHDGESILPWVDSLRWAYFPQNVQKNPGCKWPSERSYTESF